MAAWNERLRQERIQRGLTQAALAEQSGLSRPTVERYERGQYKPTRDSLIRLGRAMGLPAAALNDILTGAGLEPLPLLHGGGGLAALQTAIGSYPWPCLVLNERVEIVAWNGPATHVAELDFARELPLPFQRNLIRIAMMQHFVDRMVNWDDVVGVMVNMFAGNQYDLVSPEKDPVYFQAIVQDIVKESPARFNTLMSLWSKTLPREEEFRTSFPVQWQLKNGQKLRFNCVMAAANRFIGATEFDWFPADAATWTFLNRGDTATQVEAPAAALAETDTGATSHALSTGDLLRQARLGSGMTQAQLATRSGVSVSTITSLERNRRALTDETARLLIDALQLDGLTTNELRLSAGLEPEPSDWARFETGLPQRHGYFRFPAEERARQARTHLSEHIAVHPWPCLVVNERGDVLSHNTVLEQVLPEHAAGELGRRPNLVRFLLSVPVRSTLANWEEAVLATLVGLLRQQPGGMQSGADVPFLVRALNDLAEEDAGVRSLVERVAQLLSLPLPTEREVFPVVLNGASGEQLSFIGTVARWTDFDTVWVIDWHPADGPTCSHLAGAS